MLGTSCILWCSRACSSHRASQSAFPAGACTAVLSSILPPLGPQTVTRRTGTARPTLFLLATIISSCLCGFVPDDQRLAALDVFLVVSHHQSASDPLILSFFGLGRSGDIHGNVLGGIMQHTTLARLCPTWIYHLWMTGHTDPLNHGSA